MTRDFNITTWPRLGYNFWGITKCASSAVKNTLLIANGFDNTNILNTVSVNKASLATYISPAHAAQNNLVNFAVTRHPMCRAISAYTDLVHTRLPRGIKAGLKADMTVDEYFDFLSATNDECDVHFRSMSWFLSEPIDKIFKLEDNFIDWDLEKIDAPTIKVHQSLKTKLNITKSHIDIIADRYKEDFARFDYDPEVFDCA